jgi:hypothetical protein
MPQTTTHKFTDRLPARTFLWQFGDRARGTVYYETQLDELARYRALYGTPAGAWSYDAPEGVEVFRCEHDCCRAGGEV